MNSHSKTKKKNLKGQQYNVEDDIFGGSATNNDDNQQVEEIETAWVYCMRTFYVILRKNYSYANKAKAILQ